MSKKSRWVGLWLGRNSIKRLQESLMLAGLLTDDFNPHITTYYNPKNEPVKSTCEPLNNISAYYAGVEYWANVDKTVLLVDVSLGKSHSLAKEFEEKFGVQDYPHRPHITLCSGNHVEAFTNLQGACLALTGHGVEPNDYKLLLLQTKEELEAEYKAIGASKEVFNNHYHNVVQWSKDRNIIKGTQLRGQISKLIEESNESLEAILGSYKDEKGLSENMTLKSYRMLVDALGDTQVVTINVAEQAKTLYGCDIDLHRIRTTAIENSREHGSFTSLSYVVPFLKLIGAANRLEGIIYPILDDNHLQASKVDPATIKVAIQDELYKMYGCMQLIANWVTKGTKEPDFLNDCLAKAYNEIKDRKGRMHNGKFVKEEDFEKYGIF